MRKGLLALGFFVVGTLAFTPPAEACGAAYPSGSYVELQQEQTLIVWDAEKRTEHFIRKPTFDGDPKTFGFFVPTPTVPAIKKQDDAVFEKVKGLLEAPRKGADLAVGTAGAPAGGSGHVDVIQSLVIDGFQVVTLAATDENALGDWLAKNHFVDKPALRAWAKAYTDKKWLITAMRYEGSSDGGKRALLATPTLRLSFQTDAPFYPYTEVPRDPKDRQEFLARSGPLGCPPTDPLCDGSWTPPRPLDVWIIAPSSMQGNIGATTGGPPVLDAALVTGTAVADALGDTNEWGFDPKAKPTWVVSHLAENVAVRNAPADVVFGPYDLPKPRLGPSLAPPSTDTEPTGDPNSLFHVDAPVVDGVSRKTKLHRTALALLALLVAAATAFALLGQRERKD